jgi:hypothetical protein
MASIAPERNPSLHLLRDHLNAALALGEDLLGAELPLDAPDRPGLRGWLRQTRELDAFVGSVRTLEYAMTARLLQARKRAEEMRRDDSRLKPLIALLDAGTVPQVDAAAELGDGDARAFDGADAALAFRAAAGLLPPMPPGWSCCRGSRWGRTTWSRAASRSAPCSTSWPASSMPSTRCTAHRWPTSSMGRCSPRTASTRAPAAPWSRARSIEPPFLGWVER